MAERTRDDIPKDQATKDLTPKVISHARRRILKAGLTAPVILTLRSKPLFGGMPGCSAWMSASYLSHKTYDDRYVRPPECPVITPS
jgi:hypothetical protein